MIFCPLFFLINLTSYFDFESQLLSKSSIISFNQTLIADDYQKVREERQKKYLRTVKSYIQIFNPHIHNKMAL
jgi:hypothetical protein